VNGNDRNLADARLAIVALAEIMLKFQARAETVDDEYIAELKHALEESVWLQSHYAKLLNGYDGGRRLGFDSADAWLARLREVQRRAEQVKEPQP
jgi:hypothetical protein